MGIVGGGCLLIVIAALTMPGDAAAQSRYYTTSSRGGVASAKQSAQIQQLYVENENRATENAAQDASITAIDDHAKSTPPNCLSSQYLSWDGSAWACLNAQPEWGSISNKPTVYSVIPPVCSGSNKALQWSGAAWSCASVSGSSSGGGGGGGCASNTGASCNGCGTITCSGSCSKTTRQCNGGR